MFPEYRDLISELKASDRYFLNMFEKHNSLDQQIKNMESRLEPGTPDEIEEKEAGDLGRSLRPAPENQPHSHQDLMLFPMPASGGPDR